jgi:hypothetical protein
VFVCCAVCHVFHSASLFVDDELDTKHGQAPLDKNPTIIESTHEFVDCHLLILVDISTYMRSVVMYKRIKQSSTINNPHNCLPLALTPSARGGSCMWLTGFVSQASEPAKRRGLSTRRAIIQNFADHTQSGDHTNLCRSYTIRRSHLCCLQAHQERRLKQWDDPERNRLIRPHRTPILLVNT